MLVDRLWSEPRLVGRLRSGVRLLPVFKFALLLVVTLRHPHRKDYTICTAAKAYEIGQTRLKLAE